MSGCRRTLISVVVVAITPDGCRSADRIEENGDASLEKLYSKERAGRSLLSYRRW